MEELTRTFDTHDPQYCDDPARLYEAMAAFRQNCPMGWTDKHGGMWVVSDYETNRRIVRDAELFSSCNVQIPKMERPRICPIELDPPEHALYREPLNQWFTRQNIARFEGDIRDQARDLLKRLDDDGCDLTTDFASPLAAWVIAHVLGAPEVDRTRVLSWATSVVDNAGRDPLAAVQAMQAFNSYALEELVVLRRDDPRDDVVSHLLGATVNGKPLPDAEVAGLAFFLLLAGYETTAKTLAGTLLHLAQSPATFASLRGPDVAFERVVEECLRFFAGVTTVRTATQDCQLGDHQVRAGDRIHLLLPSGNRDDREFERAEELDPTRNANHHLSFGLGIHRCLGMHLARLELRVGLEEFLAEVEAMRPLSDKPSKFNMAQTWGFTSVPVTLTRAS